MRNYEEKDEESITKMIVKPSLVEPSLYLEQMALEGFREKLMEILREEVDEYIKRVRYERGEEKNRYRNGYGKERKITIGCGTTKIKVPRTRDGFKSRIISSYQKRSVGVYEMILDLYLHGISTGDFNFILKFLTFICRFLLIFLRIYNTLFSYEKIFTLFHNISKILCFLIFFIANSPDFFYIYFNGCRRLLKKYKMLDMQNTSILYLNPNSLAVLLLSVIIK